MFSQIKDIKQWKGETIAQYDVRLQSLVEQVGYDVLEIMKMDNFINILLDTIRAQINNMNPKIFKQVVHNVVQM